MARVITTDLALKIARKLHATINRDGKAHDLALIWHNGKVVASFGIRRGSKDLGHDHVPAMLHLRANQAKQLAQCTMSEADWITVMREGGWL